MYQHIVTSDSLSHRERYFANIAYAINDNCTC